MLTKNSYEAPSMDIITIRMEQGILALSEQSNSASNGYESENDLGEI